MPKWLPYLAMLIVVLAVGGGACGYLTFYAFGEWRKASQWQDAYDEAKRKGDKDLGEFFFGSPDPTKRSANLDAALKPEYEAAAKKSDAELGRFLSKHVMPNPYFPWLAVLGVFGVVYVLSFPCHRLFLKHNRRMMFITAVTGTLSGYFFFLAVNNIYPMGIDLAGGTELIYRLDFSSVDRRIDTAQRLLNEAQAQQAADGNVAPEKIRRLRADWQALEDSKRTAPDKATEVVRKRVDPTGAKGIPITSYDEGKRIRIQLPKASPEEVERIKRAIRTQGRLTFNLVARQDTDREIITKVMDPKNPTHEYGGYELMNIEKKDQYDPKLIHKEPIVVERIPRLEGSRVVFAGASRSHEGGWEINLRFDAAGSSLFEEMTAANVNRRMAIILDGVCHSAPVIKERIGGDCRISGSFSQKEASELASILQAGSLPADVAPESEFMVGPALGNEQIQAGITATIIGTVAVALFMWFYYRLAGFVAALCIMLLLLESLGALGFFKATMTLPGIAGILLNLAMAVDANVLIYERIREEQDRGRPLRLAVQAGFDRAFLTIIDSQLTTLISGLVLYYVGSGPVRGFAVTLCIGILLSLFTNLWVTRQIIEWIAAREMVLTLQMRQFFRKTSFDFMGSRWYWMGTSIGLVTLSLLAFGYMGVYKSEIYDVDFTGGTLVQFNFAKGHEQPDEAVKNVVGEKLKPGLKDRIEQTAKQLRELAASGKKEEELRQTITLQMPVVAAAILGDKRVVAAEDLTAEADRLDKVIQDWDKFDLIVQSFGQPVAGEGQRYQSYTVTTRLSENVIVDTLVAELNKAFAGDIEPQAIADNGKAVRFRLDLEGKKVQDSDHLRQALTYTLDKLANAEENTGLKDVMKALQVSKLKEEDLGGTQRPYLELSPLPEDKLARSRLTEVLQTVRLRIGEQDYRAPGPISRKSSFGPQVSGEMGRTAIMALLASLVGIFLYLWFRFEFSGAWGYGAIVALIHDSIISVGACCLVTACNWPVLVDLNLVAAVLTIIGYSVNDTIVIYDRIREVKSAHPTRNLGDIVNEACNATLSRTILTSLTVWIALVSLLIFGGQTVRSLAFTLWVGVIVGTYSSIFIASPLMVWWYRKFGATFATYPTQPSAQESAPSGAQI